MSKDPLSRFSLSMPQSLVHQLDRLMAEKGCQNRSLAIADMVRQQLVAHQAKEGNQDIAGTITLVYDHHKRNIQTDLTDIQHDWGTLIIATVHVHLDHHNCMEVLSVRGKSKQIQALANRLIATKGIKHGQLTVTTTGQSF
ncbi:MAG: hypothetical protein ACD_62C00259G0002 [uncultured bacterium]|nr:MAG: hypothetical protein ACD_62C00259G0002 [uncultured bacterium]